MNTLNLKKKHFIALGLVVGRMLDNLAQWSEVGSGGRIVGLDVAEDCILAEMGRFVKEQGGDTERWKEGIRRKGK